MGFFEGGVCRSGKHTGKHINEVPDGYLEWLLKDSEENVVVVKAELTRRKFKVDNSFMMKIIKEGHKVALSQATSDEERKKIDYAYQNLEQAVIDAGKVGEP